MINMHTEFEVTSLSRSRDILGGLKILNGPRDVTTPMSWTVCYLYSGTCYFKPTHQISSVYDYLQRRYERQRLT